MTSFPSAVTLRKYRSGLCTRSGVTRARWQMYGALNHHDRLGCDHPTDGAGDSLRAAGHPET